MEYELPNGKQITLNTIILDLNGTLTIDGKVVDGVHERIKTLQDMGLRVLIFSGDTLGQAAAIAKELSVELILAANGKAKRAEAKRLDPETTVSIGNGLIDAKLTKLVKLGIVVIQEEGAHTKTLRHAKMVFRSILDALDFLIYPKRLIASMRP